MSIHSLEAYTGLFFDKNDILFSMAQYSSPHSLKREVLLKEYTILNSKLQEIRATLDSSSYERGSLESVRELHGKLFKNVKLLERILIRLARV